MSDNRGSSRGGQRGGRTPGGGAGNRGGQQPRASGGATGAGPGRQAYGQQSNRGNYRGTGAGGQRPQGSHDGGGDRRQPFGQRRDFQQNQQQRGGGDGRPNRPQTSQQSSQLPVKGVKVDIKRQAPEKKTGTEGTEVELITNHYPVQIEATPCFHYDIDIKLRKRDGNTLPFRGPPTDKAAIISKMVEEWPQVFSPDGNAIPYASDASKILFTKTELGFDGQETRDVTIELDGFPKQTFEIGIQFVNEVNLNLINDYFDNQDVDFGLTHVRDIQIQVFDIVTAHNQKQTHICFGNGLFPRDVRSGNPMIGFGHIQSLVMTESALTLNIDRLATAFRTGTQPQPLPDFINNELNLRIPDIEDSDGLWHLSHQLNGLKIFTNHIVTDGERQKRKDTIDRLIPLTALMKQIKLDSGETVTIAKYYLDRYGINLQCKDWPLVEMRGGPPNNRKHFPLELCTVYPNQEMPKSLIGPDLQNQLTTSTNSMKPNQRFAKIQESRDMIVNDDMARGNLIGQFGLTIGNEPIRVTGRRLNGPKMDGDKFHLKDVAPGGLKNYLFIYLPFKARRYIEENFDKFFNGNGNLVDTARQMGLQISNQPMEPIDTQRINDPMVAFKRIVDGAVEKFRAEKKKIELMFVVMPDNSQQVYDAVKVLADIDYGIPCQGINQENFLRIKRGYFNLFTYQLNAKLNGRNQALSDESLRELPAFLRAPTMIIGADVCHPGYHNPLANEKVISSIAAVVGTYDNKFSKYASQVSALPARTEIISNLDVMVASLLETFSSIPGNQGIPGKYPKHIVFFRDGVSESQLDAVLKREVPLIDKAYDKLGASFHPKITVFVVQKRHHTRFLPVNPDTKSGNIASGTYVDDTITSPLYAESFMASHDSPLGTSRPTKYIVIRDDHEMTADQKHRLEFYMCFAYCGCSTPISIPVAVKYADLRAYRAKQHLNSMELDVERQPRRETDEAKREREIRTIQALNGKLKVHQNLQTSPFWS